MWMAAVLDPAVRCLIVGLVYVAVSRGTVVVEKHTVRYRPEWVVARTYDELADRLVTLLRLELLPDRRRR
jgi:hypothetical protein